MSNLLPAESLIKAPADAKPFFDLAAPNPILGKTVFLRLSASADWSYEIDPAGQHARRNLILRDQMWVTEGQARFVAVHRSGARADITVVIRRWKLAASGPDKDGEAGSTVLAPPDDRLESRSVLSRLRLTGPAERSLRIRCHHTHRQIELRWKTSRAVDIEPLLSGLQCH